MYPYLYTFYAYFHHRNDIKLITMLSDSLYRVNIPTCRVNVKGDKWP